MLRFKASYLLLVFGLISAQLSQAQIVGGNVGMNYNSLRSLSDSKAESFTSGLGYSIQLQLEDIYNPISKLGLALQLDQYQGSFRTLTGSPMSSQLDEGTTEKLQLGLVILPFQLLFFGQLQLQLGAEMNFLLRHQTTGNYSSNGPGAGAYTLAYDNPASDFQKNTSFGLVGKVAYRIPISTQWLLVPQLRYHYGLSSEMGIVASIASSRAVVGCGLMYRLKTE